MKYSSLDITDECIHNNSVIVAMLIKLGADPSCKNNAPIRWASFYGHVGVVRLLLADERVDPTAENNFAIRLAIYNRHIEVVQLLQEDPRVTAAGWRQREVV